MVLKFSARLLHDSFINNNLDKRIEEGVDLMDELEDRVESVFSFSEFDNAEALRADIQQFLKANIGKINDT